MNEIWKPVPEFEGRYEVSTEGRVRSWVNNYGNRRNEPKILNPRNDRDGYSKVALCNKGKMNNFLVHRLVAMTFIQNPLNLPCINHKDEDKTNNRIDNLEWCDRKYNNNYGSRNERISKVNSRSVLQYDRFGNLVKEWSSTIEVSRQTGWCHGNISKCCNGKYNTAYGFVWRYKEGL